MKRVVFIVLASLILPSGRYTPAASQIPPPQFSKTALLNGMEILFLPTAEQRSRFLLMIQNGAAFDPVGKWGVTELTTRMMLEQTARRTGEQLRQDLALLGAELEAQVGWDAIYFSGSAPAERVGDALNVLAEVVVRPDFRQEVFERVRQDLADAVRRESRTPALRTQQVFLRELFDENPYGHPVEGTVQTLESLLLNDVKIQYRRLFLPNQTQLAVLFPGDHTPLFRSLARNWGSWVRGEAAPFTFRKAEPPDQSHAVILDVAEPSAGLIRVGSLSVSRNQPEFYELEVLQHYLTLSLTDWARQVTSQTQIQASVRLEARRMPGFLQLSVQAPPSQLVQYAFKFRELLEGLQKGRLELERFKEAKELAFLDLRRKLENPESRLRQLLEVHLHGLGISFLTTYGIRLDRVGPGRFQAVLQDVLSPSRLLLVAAGDADFLRPELEAWGEVEILN